MTFEEFILLHENDDPAALLLARHRFPDIDIDLAATTIECRRRLRRKVPAWYAVPSLRYPSRLAAEQCSSEETAMVKAMVALSIAAEGCCFQTALSVAAGCCRLQTVASDPSQASLGPSLLHCRGWHGFATDTSFRYSEGNGADRADSSSEKAVFEDRPTVLGNLSSEKADFEDRPVVLGASSSEKAVFEDKAWRIADLTGGMGVDSWAFSQVFGEVVYNEMQPALAEATKENFARLGVTNVQFRCRALLAGDYPDKPGNDEKASLPANAASSLPANAASSLPANAGNLLEVLDGFRPDVIYLDPARRAEDGRKVFRLADCQPDVLTLLPEIYAVCPKLLLKLSPMADITQLSRELPGLKAVTVVGADGECKELLLHLERDYTGLYTLTVCENGHVLAFDSADKQISPLATLGRNDNKLLFEPGKALAKTGRFAEIGQRFGLVQIGASTHLYTADSIPEELRPFGKVFEIEEVLPLNNETFRSLKKRIPAAEITARNLPLTSDALRKKLGIASGGTQHLFGVRSDASGNLLLITTPVFCK